MIPWNKGTKGLQISWNKGRKFPEFSRENSASWKGGRMELHSGYMAILKPEHPYAHKSGYVLEHRLVMKQSLGRYLKPDEIVHHMNHNPSDNRPENLMLIQNNSKHMSMHTKGKNNPNYKDGKYYKYRLEHGYYPKLKK